MLHCRVIDAYIRFNAWKKCEAAVFQPTQHPFPLRFSVDRSEAMSAWCPPWHQLLLVVPVLLDFYYKTTSSTGIMER